MVVDKGKGRARKDSPRRCPEPLYLVQRTDPRKMVVNDAVGGAGSPRRWLERVVDDVGGDGEGQGA